MPNDKASTSVGHGLPPGKPTQPVSKPNPPPSWAMLVDGAAKGPNIGTPAAGVKMSPDTIGMRVVESSTPMEGLRQSTEKCTDCAFAARLVAARPTTSTGICVSFMAFIGVDCGLFRGSLTNGAQPVLRTHTCEISPPGMPLGGLLGSKEGQTPRQGPIGVAGGVGGAYALQPLGGNRQAALIVSHPYERCRKALVRNRV